MLPESSLKPSYLCLPILANECVMFSSSNFNVTNFTLRFLIHMKSNFIQGELEFSFHQILITCFPNDFLKMVSFLHCVIFGIFIKIQVTIVSCLLSEASVLFPCSMPSASIMLLVIIEALQGNMGLDIEMTLVMLFMFSIILTTFDIFYSK